jgi:hypothetical protein
MYHLKLVLQNQSPQPTPPDLVIAPHAYSPQITKALRQYAQRHSPERPIDILINNNETIEAAFGQALRTHEKSRSNLKSMKSLKGNTFGGQADQSNSTISHNIISLAAINRPLNHKENAPC